MNKNDYFDFPLSKSIKYAHAGEQLDAKFIQFISPSKKQMEHNIALKEAFFKAIKANQDQTNTKDVEDRDPESITGEEVIALLYMTPGVNMFKVLLSAIELFKSGVAKIDGSEKLTQPIIEMISQEDLEGMTGEYIVNFTIASFLKSQQTSKDTS